MNPDPHPTLSGFRLRAAAWWLQRPTAFSRLIPLGLLALLSLPAGFVEPPDMGLDPSWMLGLQVAATQGKIFGQEFVSTYGPLGYLFIHADVNKAALLLYDLFVLFSLVSLYRALLPSKPAWLDCVQLILLAVITKACLWNGSPTVLFGLLGYWLWSVQEKGNVLSLVGTLVAAGLLFFGKVNYGLVMVALVPTYATALFIFNPSRRWHGMVLWFGFPLLLWLGSLYWRVDLAGYLRSGQELIAGYSEAMTVNSGRTSLWSELNCPFQKPLGVEFSWPYLLAIGLVVWWGRGRLVWRAQLLLFLPLSCGLLLLFKNAFVRADGMHLFYFYQGLPLLLAVWCLAWRQFAPLRLLFLFSLCYPLALLSARAQWNWSTGAESLPIRYVAEVIRYPWSGGADYLQTRLNARYPAARLPDEIRTAITRATVDVMPWEASLAIANGLNYQPRPIPQSYSAYTPWLDGLNAHHLAASNAPDYILYSAAQPAAIDDRPAAWDEAQAKRALLENYSYQTEFLLPQKVGQAVQLKSANTFLLRHTPRVRRLVPVSTNAVVLQLNQTLSIPTTTNLIFLTLQVDRSVFGKLQSAALAPSLLAVRFQFEDGTAKICRAILPILQTGVLVNRRVESEADIGNWLKAAAFKNPAITAISFSNVQPWAIQTPLTGQLIEYRLQASEVEK